MGDLGYVGHRITTEETRTKAIIHDISGGKTFEC